MLILLMAGLPPVLADENENTKEYVNETKQSSIRGRIVDKSGQTLPGATIFIESLHTGAISDINGFYTLANLPVGTYKIKISYVGYSPVELTITVPEGKTVERDVTLSEGIELQEVVVGGTFQGQRRALASQKNAMGISNVVSADQVGKFPDSNIGDALKRISGINVQYDQGEARFGQVRGTSADLSSVTINGNRIPSAEGDTRNVQLDLIPADMVQTIEVNKVVTADMDGDAIGGSINLITKNTPYRRVFNANVGTGYNWISDKMQLNLGLTYGDRFFNDKLGLMAAISYQNYNMEKKTFQTEKGARRSRSWDGLGREKERRRPPSPASLRARKRVNRVKTTARRVWINRDRSRYRTTVRVKEPVNQRETNRVTKFTEPPSKIREIRIETADQLTKKAMVQVPSWNHLAW